jgi:hypothetical protein
MGITPLEFLLPLVRDEELSIETRTEAAKAAAPYLHRKMPIALEGGDLDRPITIDAGLLVRLTHQRKCYC